MIRPQSSGRYSSAGALAAIAASLCCVTPVIALFAGSSSLLANFGWIEPARPYLIATSIAVLSFAWYLKLKSASGDLNCNCDSGRKTSFMQSKAFLSIVTCFAVVMMTFPLYAKIFYPKANVQMLTASTVANKQVVQFSIQGMTCTACEGHVDNELAKLAGVLKYKTSYDAGSTLVSFDSTMLAIGDIEKAIIRTGYQVTGKHIVQP